MPLKNLSIIALFLLLSLPLTALADDVIWEYNDDGGIYTARPIPDLDDDGIDDVVFAGYYSDYGDVLYCVSGVDGTTIWTKDYADGDITLGLYDLGGRRVAVVAQGFFTAGSHTLTLTGDGLASGVYLLRLTALGETVERTMVLSR